MDVQFLDGPARSGGGEGECEILVEIVDIEVEELDDLDLDLDRVPDPIIIPSSSAFRFRGRCSSFCGWFSPGMSLLPRVNRFTACCSGQTYFWSDSIGT